MLKTHNLLSEDTLASLLPLDANVIVASEQTNDELSSLCKKYRIKHVPFLPNCNYADERGKLVEEGWNMFIEPGEVLGVGHEKILEKISNEPACYRFYVLKSNIITKEIRLWHEGQATFRNPVYETLSGKGPVLPEIVIYSKNQPAPDSGKLLDAIKEWRIDRPMIPDSYYYEAFLKLSEGKYDEFTITATNYLNQAPAEMAATMMRYYLATIQINVYGNISQAVKNVITCIAAKPQMAEFWCLLGDCYYRRGIWKKSKIFYENAVALGRRRSQTDEWPFDIAKYKEYPDKMIASCNSALNESEIYLS